MSDATTNPLLHRYVPPAEVTRHQCRRLYIPDHEQFRAAINELLSRLMIREVWEATPFTMSADDAATLAGDMLVKFWRDDCMIGMVLPHARAEIPEWALPCDGSEYNRADYPDLYDIIANDFHTSDDTFITPNLKGTFVLAGYSEEYNNFTDGGDKEVQIQEENLPQHRHGLDPHTHGYQGTFVTDSAGGEIPLIATFTASIPSVTDLGGGGETGVTGNDEPLNIMPPYTVMPYIIVAK